MAGDRQGMDDIGDAGVDGEGDARAKDPDKDKAKKKAA